MANGIEMIWSISDFVAVLNQTLEYAYPFVTIEGELSNFRISRNRWVYFDLKDETASVRFFGTVYSLPGPLEDGMMLRVSGSPRLHPQYNFSVNVQSIALVGEGNIKRAADLLQAKLAAEGLFDESRKRSLPTLPQRIGLVTAANSAAYADFIKIARARWRGLEITLADVQVQGSEAPPQLVTAIEQFNRQAELPDVLVMVRGGGSADDLQAFSNEAVVRAVAASRIPTLVAIGHEVDISLAELAADRRASTPSNAAELLLPDRREVLARLQETRHSLDRYLQELLRRQKEAIRQTRGQLEAGFRQVMTQYQQGLAAKKQLLRAYDPTHVLARGYALVRDIRGAIITQVGAIEPAQKLQVELKDGNIGASVLTVRKTKP